MRLSEYDISSSGPLKTLWIPPGSLHSFLVRMCGYRLLPSHPQDLPPEDHPFPQYKDRSIFLLQMRPVFQIPWRRSAHTLRILQSLHFPVHSTSFLLCCSLRRWLRSHVLFRRFQQLILSLRPPMLLPLSLPCHLQPSLSHLRSGQLPVGEFSTLPAPSLFFAKFQEYLPVLLPQPSEE